jgi:sugar lactone lactonase YvrE
MADLATQLRNYLDGTAPEVLLSDVHSLRTVRPVLQEAPTHRRRWLVLAAAASAALAAIVLAVLLWPGGGPQSTPVVDDGSTVPSTTVTVSTTAAGSGIVVDVLIDGSAPLLAVSAQEVWTSFFEGRSDPTHVWHFADGVWVSHSLPGGVRPQRLAVAPDGTVWAAAGGRVLSFDGVEWTRRSHRAADVAVGEAGVVWIGGQLGDHRLWLARLDGRSWTRVDPDPQVLSRSFGAASVAVTPDGEVWIGGWFEEQMCFFMPCPSGTELMRYDGATLEAVPIESPEGTRLPAIMALEAAPDGTVWARTDAGLFSYDGAEWALVDVECPSFDRLVMDLPDANDLAVGPDGTVWFNCARGLVSFDGTEWATWVEGQWVYAVDVAPDGTVWYSSETGLHTLTP